MCRTAERNGARVHGERPRPLHPPPRLEARALDETPSTRAARAARPPMRTVHRAAHLGPQARTRDAKGAHTLHSTHNGRASIGNRIEPGQNTPTSLVVCSPQLERSRTCGPHAYLTVCLLGNGGFRRGRANAGRELLAFGLCEAGGRVGLLQDRVGGGRDVQARNGRTGGATCDAHGMYGARARRAPDGVVMS